MRKDFVAYPKRKLTPQQLRRENFWSEVVLVVLATVLILVAYCKWVETIEPQPAEAQVIQPASEVLSN